MTSPDAPESSAKLNILGLPSQTSLLFAVIMAVIAVPVLLSTTGNSPFCGPVLPIALAILTLRDFLRRPELERARGQMTDLASQCPLLASRIQELAPRLQPALRYLPELLITRHHAKSPYAFGTWRRQYLAFPQDIAQVFERILATEEEEEAEQIARVDAIILHELGHFANGDVWRTHLSYSLLKMTSIFMLFNLISSLLLPTMWDSTLQFTQFDQALPGWMLNAMPSVIQELARNPPQPTPVTWAIFRLWIFSAHWPLIVGSLILLFITWRGLLRTREHYCDVRAEDVQGSHESITQAISWLDALVSIQPAQTRPRIWRKFLAPFALGFPTTADELFFRPLMVQPSPEQRELCLKVPEKIYGSPVSAGCLVGCVTFLLYLILGSLFVVPLLLGLNPTIPFTFGFVTLSLTTLPWICRHGHQVSTVLKVLGQQIVVFLLVFLTPVLLIGTLSLARMAARPEEMDFFVYVLFLIPAAEVQPQGIDVAGLVEWAQVAGTIMLLVLLPLTLSVWLSLDYVVKRRMLTWYGWRWLQERPKWMLVGVTMWFAILLHFLLLPIFDALILSDSGFSSTLSSIMQVMTGAVLLVAGSITFWHLDRSYARRCPGCARSLPGPYVFGAVCSECGERLNPWLVRPAATLALAQRGGV
jgi:hypothetical protein